MSEMTPMIWFEDQAEEAANFYVSLFKSSKIGAIRRYGEAGPGEPGAAMVVEFSLDGQDYMALNGGADSTVASPDGPFQGAVALFVTCETQAELDHLWDGLSAGGRQIQCGWLNDRYGVTWNLVPAGMSDVLHGADPEKSARATRAMLQMKKLDIDALRRAYDGASS